MSTALHTWADRRAMHPHIASMDLADRLYRASLTPQQLLGYRVFCGELAAECPACGAAYPELGSEEHPDMVGTTYTTIYRCCGHSASFNDALEYDSAGRVVDVR